MKILVTGGTGLVGEALKKITSIKDPILDNKTHKYYFLSSTQCDLTKYFSTVRLFEEIRPDVVIHLAACVGGLFKNMNEKVNMFEKNSLINLNVIQASYTVGVKRLIACLSTCIFPDKTSYPIDETMLHDGPPHHSNDAYAYAKRMLEVHCKAYNTNHDTNYVCIIPTNIYGPHDNFSLTDGHVIPALIHKCYLAKKNGTKFKVCGSGKPLRQFIYSQDLARLIMWTIFHYPEKTPIILSPSPDSEVSIRDVSYQIAEAFNYTHNIVFYTSYPDGQYKKTADNKKLRDYLKQTGTTFNFTPINEGICTSVKWFINNYDTCRK